jgi:hypothetical protein
LANGVDGHSNSNSSTIDDTTHVNRAGAPPIDEVDIGIVPPEVMQAAQGVPRSHENPEDSNSKMDVE